MPDHAAHLQAILDAATEAAKANPTAANIGAVEKARKAVDEYARVLAGDAAGERFKTQTQALEYLQRRYRIEKSKLSKDCGSGRVPRKGGYYFAKDLDYYAEADHLPAKNSAPMQIDDFGDDVKRETARKLRIANEEREGLLISRSLVEQELSARLAFLKRDLFNLGPRAIDALVEKFCIITKEQGVDLDGVNLHSLIADMEQYWEKNISAYLDSYARPRGFLPAPKNGDEA